MFGLLSVGFVSTQIEGVESMSDEEREMIEARQKFFGKQYVDENTGKISPDQVIFSWVGVSNFAVAINGRVILLDAWIPGGEESNYIPATPDELAALQPEAIFIGHAHFDHVNHAAEIIEKSGATLIGTSGHCEQVKKEAEKEEAINCIEAIQKDASPGSVQKLKFLEGVKITAISHVHSAIKLPDINDDLSPLFPKKDRASDAPKGDMKKLLASIGEDEGGAIMYQFQVGDFTFTWNDSAGPIKEEAPDLTGILASLSETDVQLGAIMGFNQYTNGLRDPRMYIEALKPKVFVPTHHDNWSPPITTTAGNYRDALEKELDNLSGSIPELIFLADPDDYVKPERLTFNILDEKWQ